MALRTEWKAVERFRNAAAMHRMAAETLLSACRAQWESELAHESVYLCGYSVECILKARFLSAIRPKRHTRALEVLKRKAGHSFKEIVVMLSGLRKPVVPSADILRSIRAVSLLWKTSMRYSALEMETKVAEEFLLISKEIAKWCES